MATTAGEDREIDREIDEIANLLRSQGPMTRGQLRERLESRFWGPGRFRRALSIAQRRGKVERVGRRLYAAAD